jgi:hypothetical protein
MRHGVHPYITQASCSNLDQQGDNPSLWMGLVADWMIGMHLTLRGTMEVIGIQAPICEGDNVEFDGVVYHVEGISHSARIEPGTGKKSFTTSLALSNGMNANSGKDVSGQTFNSFQTTGAPNAGLPPEYPGLEQESNTQYDPGLTVDDEGGPGIGDG